MKKLTLLCTACMIIFLSACGNNENEKANEDTTYNQPPAGPAPDNSNATNPSLPDTAFTDSVPR